MENTKTFVNKTMNLVAQNNLKEALKTTQQLLKGSPLFSEVIVHSSRYNDVMKAIRLGTIHPEDANIEKNKLRFALLDILNELSENTQTNPTLATEVETFLQERTASTSNSLSIEGNNNTVIQGVTGSNVSINTGTVSNQNAEKIYNIEKIDKADFS